jgi:hypothetical protein
MKMEKYTFDDDVVCTFSGPGRDMWGYLSDGRLVQHCSYAALWKEMDMTSLSADELSELFRGIGSRFKEIEEQFGTLEG